MTDLSNEEAHVLSLIYDLSGAGTNKILNRKAVSAAAGLSSKAGERVLQNLTARRFIRYILFGSLCITEAGIIAGRMSQPKPEAEIFLSYRRSDTQDIVERMFDRLTADFGREKVFQDLNSGIPGGAKFADHLRHSLAGSKFVLVVIGPTWLEGSGTQSRPRLFEDDDLLRAEIESAMTGNCVVIPVCVGGAKPPEAVMLPQSIRGLAGLQVMHVRRGADFHPDMDKLISMVSSSLPRQANSHPTEITSNTAPNQGSDNCAVCHGAGRNNCPWCHGAGRKICTSCGGSGQKFVGASKTNPSGRGRCTSCAGGRMTCTCAGGKVVCHACGGSGKLNR